MIISAIRFRGQGQSEWQAFKLSLGTGRFRSIQCVVAPAPLLRGLAAALAYAVLGEQPAELSEVVLQLSDDAGHAWTVQRRGDQARILRDGALLAGGGEDQLAAALLDLESGAGRTTLARFEVHAGDGGNGPVALPLGRPGSPRETLRDAVLRQIGSVAGDCARAAAQPTLADPKLLSQLARQLEPLHTQYKELCRQYAELGGEAAAGTAEAPAEAAKLTAELDLLSGLAETAAPLLQPGVSLKALKDELAKVEGELAECCAGLGIEPAAGGDLQLPRDFRKAIEALSRLEAYAKLIRAAQGARKHCAQNVEPPFRRYLEAAEGSLAGDRQVIGELESCLAALTLRQSDRPRAAAEPPAGTAPGQGAAKTWFDRFKSRAETDDREAAAQSAQAAAASAHDIETARLAIEFALGRLTELGEGASAARERHDSALSALDEANEELVRSYGRLRDHWLRVAQGSHLPEDLDLNGLLRIAAHHGRLVALGDARTELTQKIRRYTARLAKVERLLLEWRTSTGSQKTVELANSTILLAEARDVLRYQEAKRQRLAVLRGEAAETKAAALLKAMLKTRRSTLAAAWRDAFTAAGLVPVPMAHPSIEGLLAAAELVRALALVHSTAPGVQATPLFAGAANAAVVALYLWDEERVAPQQRLAFLSQLEATDAGGLTLLLLADESLASMLAPLGVGLGARLAPAPVPAPAAASRGAQADTQSPPRGGGRPAATPAPVVKAAAGSPGERARTPPPAALLNERARHALEMLSGRKG